MTARERQRRRRRRGKDPSRFFLFVGGGLLGALVDRRARRAARVTAIAKRIPPLSQLKITTYGQASTVYDAEGHVLGVIKARSCASRSRPPSMPVFLREATVAIEDHGFYQHGAVDSSRWSAPRSPTSSPATACRAARRSRCSSSATSTRRRRREDLPAQDQGGDHREPLREAALEAWILTDYLNTVPYGTVGGQTAEGVESASWTFFDHPAWKDTLAQCALLAGLPQAPTDYNPFHDPAPRARAATRARRDGALRLHHAARAAAACGAGPRASSPTAIRSCARQLVPRLRQAQS